MASLDTQECAGQNIRDHLLEPKQSRLQLLPRGDVVLSLFDKWGMRDASWVGWRGIFAAAGSFVSADGQKQEEEGGSRSASYPTAASFSLPAILPPCSLGSRERRVAADVAQPLPSPSQGEHLFSFQL